jgi:tetratricopeptide (TPR) repeat protein
VTTHLEDFAILRYVTKDLKDDESSVVASHLLACSNCTLALGTMRRLDAKLRNLAARGEMNDSAIFLSRSDPFYCRPDVRATSIADQTQLGLGAVEAAARGAALVPQVLVAAREPAKLRSLLSSLEARRAEHRFGLFYALHEAGRASAEDPFKAMSFARSTLGWIRLKGHAELEAACMEAERMVPRAALRAQAHLLLAIAHLWTSRYSRASAHLMVAYRGFAAGGGDETKLALVELAEAQRRALSHEPVGAIALVRRARETFADRGLDDYVARASVAEGLALAALNQHDEALRAYREALPVFESLQLWSNYVGALNSVATSLSRLGRHDEARREYARALKRFSGKEHRYWHGYIRLGLAEALFAAGRFGQGAVSAARAAKLFDDCKLRAQSLLATLLEIESSARNGDLSRARHRLRLFWMEVQRDCHLDRAILEHLNEALSGTNPTFERLPALRALAGDQIRERCRTPRP